jgi:hypothetical protein
MSNKVITIAAAIILNEQNQILLVRKKDTDFFMHVAESWNPMNCLKLHFLGKFWKKQAVRWKYCLILANMKPWLRTN